MESVKETVEAGASDVVSENVFSDSVKPIRNSSKSYVISDQVDASPSEKQNETSDNTEDDAKNTEESYDAHTCESRSPPTPIKQPIYYKINHSKRGLVLVLNHKYFDKETRQSTRNGTEVDVERIMATFGKLNFEVKEYPDLTYQGIENTIKEIQQSYPFEQVDCLFIFILTHGEETILWAKNKSYNLNEIFTAFTPDKCPGLSGKPKIFVIQSCRGKGVDDGIVVKKYNLATTLDGSLAKKSKSDVPILYKLPLFTDFLCAWSTLHGHYSFRKEDGSPFIQSLCLKMDEYYDRLSFCDILSIVNGQVAEEFESHSSIEAHIDKKKQTSTFTSQLTKVLSFSPNIDDNLVENAKVEVHALKRNLKSNSRSNSLNKKKKCNVI